MTKLKHCRDVSGTLLIKKLPQYITASEADLLSKKVKRIETLEDFKKC